MKIFKTMFVASGMLATLALANPAAATTVLSDNFDAATQGLNWSGDGVFTSTSPPGSVDLIGTGFYDLYPGNGNYVDLDGSTGSGNNPAGEITSVLMFGPSHFLLNFMAGGNNRGAPPQTLVISLGDWSTSLTLASSDPLAAYAYDFTTSVAGNLRFTEMGPSDQQGNVLDNVVLSSVPEPATWALMITGFGLAGLTLRRRQRASMLV